MEGSRRRVGGLPGKEPSSSLQARRWRARSAPPQRAHKVYNSSAGSSALFTMVRMQSMMQMRKRGGVEKTLQRGARRADVVWFDIAGPHRHLRSTPGMSGCVEKGRVVGRKLCAAPKADHGALRRRIRSEKGVQFFVTSSSCNSMR